MTKQEWLVINSSGFTALASILALALRLSANWTVALVCIGITLSLTALIFYLVVSTKNR